MTGLFPRFGRVLTFLLLVLLMACRDDSYLTEPPPLADNSFYESFDDYQEAYDKGWRAINRSLPVGRKYYDITETPIITSPNYVAVYYPEWNQAQFTLDSAQFGLQTPFPGRIWANAFASQRASNGYVATSLVSAELVNLTGPSTTYKVNNWLVSPQTSLRNGDKIAFYTYCRSIARLQVWVNESGSTDVGAGIDLNNTGDFKLKLLDINPLYIDAATDSTKAYPQQWTRFEAEVQGLPGPVNGRFAFRYLLQDGVPSSATTFDELFNEIHESVIGIDEIVYTGLNK